MTLRKIAFLSSIYTTIAAGIIISIRLKFDLFEWSGIFGVFALFIVSSILTLRYCRTRFSLTYGSAVQTLISSSALCCLLFAMSMVFLEELIGEHRLNPKGAFLAIFIVCLIVRILIDLIVALFYKGKVVT